MISSNDSISNKNQNKLSTIKLNEDDRFHIWTNIVGMCTPLQIPFVENDQNYIVHHVSWKNLYPYLKNIDGSMGFLLRQPNGNFKLPAKSAFRMMFCSRNFSIAPEKNIPSNNRIIVKDENEKEVEICYWPDEFLKTKIPGKYLISSMYQNNTTLPPSSSTSTSSSTTTKTTPTTSTTLENTKILDFIHGTSFNLFFK